MIKHPLVQKEWKSVRWMMLLFLGISAFFAVTLSNNMYDEKISHLLRDHTYTIFMGDIYRIVGFMTPVLLIGVLVLATLLFTNERNLYVGKFISSLPFTRKEQFTIKYTVGVIVYTLPLILFGIVAYVIRTNNESWINQSYKYLPYGDVLAKQDGVGELLLWLGIAWLILTTVYSFLMMIQTLMGQNIIAGVVGGIILFVPWFIGFAIPANLELLGINSLNHPNWLNWTWQFFFFAKPQWFQEQMEIAHKIDRMGWYSISTYRHLPLCIAALIAIIIISTLLAYQFIQHNDVEKNGDIVMYPWVGKILVLGITVCSLLLLPIIVVIFTRIESRIITLVSMAIGGTLGYVLSTRSIDLTRRHG